MLFPRAFFIKLVPKKNKNNNDSFKALLVFVQSINLIVSTCVSIYRTLQEVFLDRKMYASKYNAICAS